MRRQLAAAARAIGAASALVAATAIAVAAQGARITGTTTARYIDLRRFVDDSVPVSEVAPGDSIGAYRVTTSGLVVRCTAGEAVCRYKRSGDAVSTLPLTQDLQLTAWGLGEGVSLYAQVRARAAMGSSHDVYPLEDRAFDAVAAYLELDRARFRARAGRQFMTSGLGFYNFDGASVLLRPWQSVSFDLYGGWSLARGLNEPRTSGAIAAVEDLPPDDRGFIVGAQVRVRPTPRASFGALYQREIRTDLHGLYSERVAVDGAVRLDRANVDASLDYDLATGNVNDGRVRVLVPIRRSLAVAVEGRHYEPFFELWTIWGAFSPVGFDEARADAYWNFRGDRLTLDAHGALRRYGETSAGVGFAPLRDDGWRLGADASWRAAERWTAYGNYVAEIGFGASRTDGTAGVRWSPRRDTYVGLTSTAFQSIEEFRVGTGRVYGAGVEGGLRLASDLRLVGDAMVYRHRRGDNPSPLVQNWSQTRASLRLEWTVGRDPGLAGVGGRGQ